MKNNDIQSSLAGSITSSCGIVTANNDPANFFDLRSFDLRGNPLSKYKICTKCKENKLRSQFRLRTKRGYVYACPTCLECDKEKSLEAYYKNRDDPEFKRKNVERATRHRENNIELIKQKDRARRQTVKHKANRKKYIKKNKDKIYQQEKICKKKYSDFQRDNLTDTYVLQKLCGKNYGHLLNVFASQPALIEAKRQQIRLLRLIKTIGNDPA